MVVPARVLNAYGISPEAIESVSGGLINATFRASARGDGRPAVALQRLHPIFAAEVNLDVEAITSELARLHMVTPRLVRTSDGNAWIEHEGKIWRALTWVQGQCFASVSSPRIAQKGAQLVGRFHRALADLDYRFRFERPGAHDTAQHIARLEAAGGDASEALLEEAGLLRAEICQQMQEAPALPDLPLRICHGDLKISNLIFDASGEGLCLVDLDTMAWQSIAFELGDALRSWANPAGEDVDAPQVDLAIVAAAATGYASGSSGLLTAPEIEAVIIGLETVCIELAARFCLDVFEDSYFGWDPKRFASRRQHNLLRAQGQLALARSVARQREPLQELWTGAFSGRRD